MLLLGGEDSVGPIIKTGGWDHDHCEICWWDLFQGPDEEHSTGYSDNRGWVCIECYNQFLRDA